MQLPDKPCLTIRKPMRWGRHASLALFSWGLRSWTSLSSLCGHCKARSMIESRNSSFNLFHFEPCLLMLSQSLWYLPFLYLSLKIGSKQVSSHYLSITILPIIFYLFARWSTVFLWCLSTIFPCLTHAQLQIQCLAWPCLLRFSILLDVDCVQRESLRPPKWFGHFSWAIEKS